MHFIGSIFRLEFRGFCSQCAWCEAVVPAGVGWPVHQRPRAPGPGVCGPRPAALARQVFTGGALPGPVGP